MTYNRHLTSKEYKHRHQNLTLRRRLQTHNCSLGALKSQYRIVLYFWSGTIPVHQLSQQLFDSDIKDESIYINPPRLSKCISGPLSLPLLRPIFYLSTIDLPSTPLRTLTESIMLCRVISCELYSDSSSLSQCAGTLQSCKDSLVS